MISKLLQEVDVKGVTKAVKEALDDSIKEKSIWEKAYKFYSDNPTEITIGVVAVVVAIYAVYLFKFDDKCVGTNSYKVTKYKKIIDDYKEIQTSNKKNRNNNNGVGGLF